MDPFILGRSGNEESQRSLHSREVLGSRDHKQVAGSVCDVFSFLGEGVYHQSSAERESPVTDSRKVWIWKCWGRSHYNDYRYVEEDDAFENLEDGHNIIEAFTRDLLSNYNGCPDLLSV